MQGIRPSQARTPLVHLACPAPIWVAGLLVLAGHVVHGFEPGGGGFSGAAVSGGSRVAGSLPEVSAAAAEALRLRGEASMLRYRETLDPQHVAQARETFEKALEADPQSADAMVGMAWVCNTVHDFAEGTRWARQALDRDPENDQAEALLGDAAVELGIYDEALEHYQRVLDLRPGLSSYSRAAHLLFLTGDPRRALWMMQKAVDTGDPAGAESAWCRAQLASMLFETGALVPAAQTAEAGLKLAPQNLYLLTVMGRIRLAQGRPEEAAACYRKALEIRETHEVLAGLGDLLWVGREHEKAEEVYRRLIALHEVDRASELGMFHGPGGAHGQLARFYADHDRNTEEALDMAQRDYDAFPNVRAADTLAWCLYRAGRYQDALRLSRRALSQGTQDAAMYYHAGLIQMALDNIPEGKKSLYKALNLNPHFHPIHAPRAVELLETPEARDGTEESEKPDS